MHRGIYLALGLAMSLAGPVVAWLVTDARGSPAAAPQIEQDRAHREHWAETVSTIALSPTEDVRHLRLWQPVIDGRGRALPLPPTPRDCVLYRNTDLRTTHLACSD